MAEKSEILVTEEEKMAEAKELFGRGSRNYCMKQYADAADDLSACCTIYSELFGPLSNECGSPYLLYAKSLIALGKDENNLIVPGEGEEEEEDDGDEDEEEGNEEGDGEVDDEEMAPEDKSDNKNSKEIADEDKAENKESKSDTQAEASSKMEVDPQAGPSTAKGEQQQNEDVDDEEEKSDSNLEVAWEILELAVKIFEEQGESSFDNLSECYAELASISLENGNFALAINDYNKALAVYDKTGKSDRRITAEIHYKIGLCHLMQNEYDDSIKAFRDACNEMDIVIEQKKAQEQDENTANAIKNLEETKKEVMEKISEVEDTKKTSIEEVKRELSKIIVNSGSTNGFDGAGPSSSSSATNGTSTSAKSAEKPTDITHLIKRKKPDSVTNEVESSPAKKTAVEADKSSD